MASGGLFTITLDAAPIIPQLSASALPLDAHFGDQLSLDGAIVGDATEGLLPVTLYWSATATPYYPSVAFVQLLDANRNYITGADVQPEPATGWWTVGETHTTQHNLTLPAGLPLGDYALVAGM